MTKKIKKKTSKIKSHKRAEPKEAVTKKPAVKSTVPKAIRKLEHKIATEQKKPKPVEYIAAANIIRWKAPDYYTFEKSPYWSLGVGLIAVIASLILIYTNNYFPVIIVILAVIVTFQVSHEKPKTQEFALDESGILSRNSYIPYTELKSYWTARHGNKSILYLEPVSSLRGPIVIPLGNQSAEEVRTFLLRFLVEKLEHGEMLSEKLIRVFRL